MADEAASTTTDTQALTTTNASSAPASEASPNDLLTATVEPTPFDIQTFKFPDGLEITDEHKNFLSEFAKDNKVSQEAMAALVKQHADTVKAISDGMGVQVQDAWNERINTWGEETKRHYGDKLEPTIAAARGVIDEFGGAAALEAIKTAGLGNNLAVIKMLHGIAKAIGEGKPVTATGAVQSEHPLAALYPSMGNKG